MVRVKITMATTTVVAGSVATSTDRAVVSDSQTGTR